MSQWPFMQVKFMSPKNSTKIQQKYGDYVASATENYFQLHYNKNMIITQPLGPYITTKYPYIYFNY